MLSFTLPPQPMNGGGGGSSVIGGTNEVNNGDLNQQSTQYSMMSVDSNPSEGSMEFEDAMEQQTAVPHNGQLGNSFSWIFCRGQAFLKRLEMTPVK